MEDAESCSEESADGDEVDGDDAVDGDEEDLLQEIRFKRYQFNEVLMAYIRNAFRHHV